MPPKQFRKKSVSSLSLEEMTRIEEMIRSLIPHHTDPMVSLDDYYKRHSALFHSVNDLSPRWLIVCCTSNLFLQARATNE